MSPSTQHQDAASARSGRRKRYDKDLVRERTLELLSVRLGPPKEQGARMVWDCPACGKREKYSVVKSSGKGGCLVADCRLAGSGDIFVMLAGLEDLDYKADFLALLAKSYDLLGLDPDSADSGKGGRPKDRPTAAARRKDHKEREGQDDAIASAEAPQAVPVAVQDRRREGSPNAAPTAYGGESSPSPEELEALFDVAARAYERILENCPLETRDRAYLKEARPLERDHKSAGASAP